MELVSQNDISTRFKSDLYPKLTMAFRNLGGSLHFHATIGKVIISEGTLPLNIDTQGYGNAVEAAWMRNMAKSPEMRDKRVSVSARRYCESQPEEAAASSTNRDKILAIRVTADEAEHIKALAAKHGGSQTDYVRSRLQLSL